MTQHTDQQVAVLAYAAIVYLLFLAVFTYTIGFLANFGVPKGVDDGVTGSTATAVIVDAALLGLFAVQHTVMARPWFKRRWTRFVPESAERSAFVLAASLVLALLLWQWHPLPDTVWAVDTGWAAAVLWVLYGVGWVVVLGSTFAIDHFDLFGLRQAIYRAEDAVGWGLETTAEGARHAPVLGRLSR